MHRASPTRRRGGFTLVELLVVIGIIVVLAAITTVAITVALRTVYSATISLDVKQIATALDRYKSAFGDYPPDCAGTAGVNPATDNPAGVLAIQRHIQLAWPRFSNPAGQAQFLMNELEPDTALVYFLSLLKPNQRNPFPPDAVPDGDEKSFFEFKPGQLVSAPVRGTIAWSAYVQPTEERAAYAYFRANTYTYYNTQAFTPVGAQGQVRPYVTNGGFPNFVEPRKFQLIAAGLDGDFGAYTTVDPTTYKRFPSGMGYTPQDDDNEVSFSPRSLKDSVP